MKAPFLKVFLGLYPDQPDLVARLGVLSKEETIPGVNLDPPSVAE